MVDLLDDKPDALQQKLDNLPTDPGVYKFLHDEGSVLYVGKAKNLRNSGVYLLPAESPA